MLQNNSELTEGIPGDELHYQKLIDFVSNNDLSQKENYDYVNTLIDIDNFITFQASEMYIGNGDWPNNNTRYWRKKTKQYDPEAAYGCDGRWRWVFYDLDGAFGGSCPNFTPGFNSIKRATNTEPLYFKYTQLLRSLLNNDNFKNNLLNRYSDLLNSNFLPKVVSSYVTEEKNLLENEMLEHVRRWRYPSVSTTLINRNLEIPSLIEWKNIVDGMQNFASVRPINDRRRLMEYFFITDTFKVNLDVSNLAAGEIAVNSITINNKLAGTNPIAYPWKGTYFKNVPITLTAIPKPGYKFLHWTGGSNSNLNKIKANLLGDESFTAIFEPDTNFNYFKSVFINEINSTNKNIIKDPYDENDDWIEIFNPSEYPIDLQGYYLSDDPSSLKKYKFPTGSKETIIAAKGFLLLWADNQKEQGVLHTPFKLNALGEQIILTAPDGNTLIDSISFGALGPDISFGRYPNGSENKRFFTQPTPQASNRLENIFNPQILIYNFNVYPNPASGNFVNFNKITDATVFNANGQLILQVKAVDRIDISNFPGGIYYLRTPEGQTAKLVKI
jgi:hypothetical protein